MALKIKNGKVVKPVRVVRRKWQPGSLKLWQAPNGYMHYSCIVHEGRTSRKVIGEQSMLPKVSLEFLRSALKEGRL